MAENEKRIIDYCEIRKLFDEEYKKTVERIRNGETHLDNLAEGFTEADMVIRRLPTADMVEVVRCKDCKWWNTGGCAFRKDAVKDLPTADDFCSHGERKE